MSRRRVVVLAHPGIRFDSRKYFLSAMAEAWREDGIETVVVHGTRERPDADAAVLHVDVTVAPPEYVDFVRSYPVAINGAIADISKRRISRQLVRRGDGWAGPVVVKTDRNCGGGPEDRLAARGTALRRAVRAVRGALPWTYRARIKTTQYPVLASQDAVPSAVWRNRDLVVERFLPEIRDGLHAVRTWVFLGDRETNSICWSRREIVKADSVVRREPCAEIPDELRAMRRDLGFDFGKFDYVLREGRVILFDANRTPTLGTFPTEAGYLPKIRHLAEGIRAFL
jgi:hypothetical protein